jgi:hypothetical protein
MNGTEASYSLLITPPEDSVLVVLEKLCRIQCTSCVRLATHELPTSILYPSIDNLECIT